MLTATAPQEFAGLRLRDPESPGGRDADGQQPRHRRAHHQWLAVQGATIGVQRPSSDPHIESFDDPDLSRLTQEALAVVERARAKWEDEPKYPAHARPAPPARSRPRRRQGSAQGETAEGVADEQPQPETLRLF